MKTRCDSIRNRNQKGFLFTIGDEPNLDGMTARQANGIGIPLEADVTAEQAVALAQRDWEVYHIVLTNVGRCIYNKESVLENWRAILPERTIPLQDVNALAETVVSILRGSCRG